ncbi:hypothetical protein N9H22_03040 [Opitutales bacterium]|nr:hypothetical protein [Opitutales bacterium]
MFLKNWGGEQVTPIEAVDLIKQKFYQRPQRRDLQPREVENAVASVFNVASKNFKRSHEFLDHTYFRKISPNSYWNSKIPLPVRKANIAAIHRAISTTPWTLYDMWEESPLRVDECEPEELLNLLYNPSDLICCGSVKRFRTISACDWLCTNYWMGDQIVPNPSRVKLGVTLNNANKLSAHSRDATGKRKYIVIESDDETLTLDEKASILRYLRDEAGVKLRMVVHSAGKSLHGWYVSDTDESMNWAFMDLACLLGADPRMWLPEQLARLPNAKRLQNQLIQKTFYFDPS